MATVVTWLEEQPWQPGKNGTLSFHVSGTNSAGDAKTAVLAVAAGSYEGLDRLEDDIQVDAQYQSTGEVALSSWKVVVPYGNRQLSEVQLGSDDAWWVLDFGYQRTNIIRSIDGAETTKAYDSKAIAPMDGYVNAITQGGERVPRGVDVDAVTLALSGRWTVPSASVDSAYLRSLVTLADNPVNSDIFQCVISGVTVSFAAGECRIVFLQTPSNPRPDGSLEFAAKILVSENLDGAVGDEFLGFDEVTKKGWQYGWVPHEQKPDATTGITVPEPLALYINTVYGTSSYSIINGGI